MNAHKSGRLNQAHNIPTFAVAPVTRAVRAALAVSLTLLALGSSSAAFAAGTCVFAAPATTSCDGAFIGTTQHPNFTPIDDPTLVRDHAVPNSVTPANGLIGIDANGGGSVGTTHADITTVGDDEIFAPSPGSASVGAAHGTITYASVTDAKLLGTEAFDDVNYVNNGPINAYGTGAYDVTAVNSYSATGGDTVDNQAAGTINAVAQDGNAVAINASGYTNATVTNEGAITASSVNGVAVGVIAQAYNGNASATNSGSITATSTGYQAVGILASSNAGYASVINSGSVTASGGQDQAVGIEAFGQTGSSVYNTGSVTATSTAGTAIGILAQTVNGNATITNTSGITVTAGYNAVGLSAITANGDASATSSGFMEVIGHGGLTSVIEAYSAVGNANASNSGFVISGSYGGNAVGVSATSGDGNATASNTSAGYLRVVAPGGATNYATGISAKTYNGDATASNDGTIYASSTLGVGIGINVSATGGNATAINTGTITALNSLFANVRGIQAIASSGEVTVTNSGTIRAYSHQVLGYPFAITSVLGIGAQSYSGTTVTNSGSISATGPWKAYGVEAISLYGDTQVTNAASGTIFASGLRAVGVVADVGYGTTYQAVVNNAGSIHVSQVGNCDCDPGFVADGIGIAALSDFAGGVAVNNTGSIIVTTQNGAYGISAHTYNDAATVNNSGTISVGTTGYGASNFGIAADSAYGSVSIVNSGKVSVTTGLLIGVGNYALNDVIGIYGHSGRHHLVGYGAGYYGAGDTNITNTGDVSITATREGTGIYAVAEYGSALVNNSGHVVVNDTFGGAGIVVRTGLNGYTTAGSAGIDNTGTVQVYGSQDARGLVARVVGGNTIDITNAGDVAVSGEVGAFGIFARNYNYTGNAINIGNSGSITATTATTGIYATNTRQSNAQAIGVRTYNYSGITTVTNSGAIVADVTSTVQRTGSAVGIYTQNGYAAHYGDTVVTNTGSITATDHSNNGTPYFHAPHGAWAAGINSSGTYGNITIGNTGSVSATARSAYFADNGLTTANGILATSTVGNSVARSLILGDIKISNIASGTISANAETTYGAGSTFATGLSGVVKVGSYGGSLISAGHGIEIDNASSVTAQAVTDPAATGSATAVGLSAINGSAAGFASINNTGGIYATAMSPGVATATGISTTAHDITVALGKSSFIVATANGAGSIATGLSASGVNVSASNLGTLKAIATGTTTTAYGVQLVSPGALTFTNTGLIRANADHAVAVDLTSGTTATLINTGTINAVPMVAYTNGIAVQTSAPNAVIQNYGTLTGKLRNGTGNFTFTNFAGGNWNAAGISDFGVGDDFIRNVGTIHLNGSAIDLGDTLGNRFTNAAGGAIAVVGNNSISMGTANANANVFVNNGTLNFQNGMVGDTLTIAGNFSGNSNGVIDMDVNGLNGTSDKLAIEGNVLAGSVNTVNVDLLTDPTTASTLVPLITVSGTSAAGSFVLGKVVQNKSFLDVLVSKPGVFSLSLTAPGVAASPSDARLMQATASLSGALLTQATSSLTSTTPSPTGTSPMAPALGSAQATSDASLRPALGIEESVTGLSDLGTLAASTAPGVQSLMNSQIGTLEDRMGAVSQTIKGGFSVWTRAFADSGTVDPGHSAGNFGQNGNFGFDQSNSGAELGLDFALSDEFKAGALFAKSQANQSLDGNQADSGKITGDTSGLYGTWISTSGFYVDGSYRWMTFNDRLHAPTGYASIHGNADAFNLEAGKTWTLQNGLQIAPQFQYTLTKVDNINAQTGTLAGFQSHGDDASRARLGVMFSKAYTPASSHAMWMPYASLSAVQELDGKNSYSVNNTFFGQTNTKGTSVLAETGVNVQIGKLALYGGLNWQDGGALKSFFGGQVGLRYTF